MHKGEKNETVIKESYVRNVNTVVGVYNGVRYNRGCKCSQDSRSDTVKVRERYY